MSGRLHYDGSSEANHDYRPTVMSRCWFEVSCSALNLFQEMLMFQDFRVFVKATDLSTGTRPSNDPKKCRALRTSRCLAVLAGFGHTD